MAVNSPLQDALIRYRRLREHDDAEFSARVATLRDWQAGRLKGRHSEALRDPEVARLLEFFADRFYRKVDLSELTQDIDASSQRIDRLLPDTRTAAAALELIALAGELDEAMVQTLGPRLSPTLSVTTYAGAYREVGRYDDRERLLGLVQTLCDDLAGFARSRIAFMAFKLAGMPARRLGLGSLYDLNYGAFEVARRVDDLPVVVANMLSTEHRALHRVAAAAPNGANGC